MKRQYIQPNTAVIALHAGFICQVESAGGSNINTNLPGLGNGGNQSGVGDPD